MNLAEMIVAKLGLDPEQLKTALEKIVADAQTVRNEVLGAKHGFGNAMMHFDQRLTRIENLVNEIHAATVLHVETKDIPQILNGAKDHE